MASPTVDINNLDARLSRLEVIVEYLESKLSKTDKLIEDSTAATQALVDAVRPMKKYLPSMDGKLDRLKESMDKLVVRVDEVTGKLDGVIDFLD